TTRAYWTILTTLRMRRVHTPGPKLTVPRPGGGTHLQRGRGSDPGHFGAESHEDGTRLLRCEVATMRREYDFSKSRPNPYAERLKESVTIRLDTRALKYFKELSATSGIPYQTLINLYLRDCAATGRKLDLQWKAP